MRLKGIKGNGKIPKKEKKRKKSENVSDLRNIVSLSNLNI